MELGIIGKPSGGKSTVFAAATLINVEIAAYPFTTIKPNRGTSFVRTKCPHKEIGHDCQPVNSQCIKGERFSPITLIDVAGLVPDAHKGKGLGNQFLNDLIQANALIHVVDASGSTDSEGKAVEKGSHDPIEDVRFLEKEIDFWIEGILKNNWAKISKKSAAEPNQAKALHEQLSGLNISEEEIMHVLKELKFESKLVQWNEEQIFSFSQSIRKKSKPIVIAANKIDVDVSEKNFERMKKEFPESRIIPCSSESELALRKAAKAGLIEYLPGDKDFKIIQELPEKQLHALEFIKEHVLEKFGSTGVQEALNQTVFNQLNFIVVYPVGDEKKWASAKGNVLPDTFLIPQNSNALQLAGKIHTDFVPRFLGAIDGRTKQRIGKEHTLKNNDVVRILLKN